MTRTSSRAAGNARLAKGADSATIVGAELRHLSRLADMTQEQIASRMGIQQADDQFVLPLLGDEPFNAQRDVVLSIKPAYSARIMEGTKTVELRRRFPTSALSGAIAFIYSTSPAKAMVGTAEIKHVLKLPIEQIWKDFKDSVYIERSDFDLYFEGLEHGCALVFEEVRTFSRPLPLAELRERFGFEPPQSFLYIKQDFRKVLIDESAIVSH